MCAPKKKVKFGSFDIDLNQFALVVNYTTEVHHFDQFGDPVRSEKLPGQKLIRVQPNMQPSEVRGYAQEVIEKCKYVPASKADEVERVLFHLLEQRGGAQEPPSRSRGHAQEAQPGGRRHRRDEPRDAAPPVLPHADVEAIEQYVDQMYEESMELKVQGVKCILRVCTDPINLEILVDHEISLLGVLSRELRDGGKKSFDLSVAVVCTFLCFSHFSQFHPALMQSQCGDAILRVVEYESHRHQVRKEDMERRRMRFLELGDKAAPEDRKLFQRDEKKFAIQVNRQCKLMHVCLMALLNLAEEIAIEKKMVNRKMPELLAGMLDRDQEDLLQVTLVFLKKLSLFEENKDTFATPHTLTRMVQLSTHPNVHVALLALHVLYNLSFDENVRGHLVESGVVKVLVDHLRNPPFRHIVLRLLYHFSMDERKSLMAYHRDGIVILLQLVVHFPEPQVGKDLVALVINLATHPRAAEVMLDSGLFPQVMIRMLRNRDPLLCKVIRHISAHEATLEPMCELLVSESVRMSRWMHEFVRMASVCSDNPDLLVEVLGTLANVTMPHIPWGELCEVGLIDLLTKLLVPGFSEDDVVLECVMIAGNLAMSQDAAQHIAGSRLPSMLQELLIEKREDEEIVVQLLFAFQCLLLEDSVRDYILQDTELSSCVMWFARARNPNVLEQATRVLQLLSEYVGDSGDGDTWAEQIKMFRFEQHNQEWCAALGEDLSPHGDSQSGGYGYGYAEDRRGGYGSGTGEESEGDDGPEFAYRFATGDAQELENRDWGNQDMSELMRASRYVT